MDVVEEGDHGGVTADGDGSKILLNCLKLYGGKRIKKLPCYIMYARDIT